MKYVSVLCLALCLMACGPSPEEEAFRKELIDKALNDETRRMGNAFLAENAKKSDVVVLPSGVQYKVLEAGDGQIPVVKDTVVVDYEGRRVDGLVFDSSIQRGEPGRFPIQRIIRGLQETLVKMPTGSTWEIYIPADLAYGAVSPQSDIPANSTLIFKLVLLDIVKDKQP